MILIKTFASVLILTFALQVVGQNNCEYKIDTTNILANKRLDIFLSELQTDSFRVTNDKKDIPRFIKKQLNCLTHGFSIANPGRPYQATDVVYKKLPRRQLVFLAKSDNLLVMTYFIGGRGRSSHVLFIKFKDKKILDLWTGYCFAGLDSKQGIIDCISQNRNKEWGLNTNIVYF